MKHTTPFSTMATDTSIVEFGVNFRVEAKLSYVWCVGRGVLIRTIHMTPYVHTSHVEECTRSRVHHSEARPIGKGQARRILIHLVHVRCIQTC